MATFQKFDPHAFLDRRNQGPGLAALATLATGSTPCEIVPVHRQTNSGDTNGTIPRYVAVAKAANAAKVQHPNGVGGDACPTAGTRRGPGFDPDTAKISALLVHDVAIGDCLLVSDCDILAAKPYLLRAGLPIIFFHEADQLRGKTATELEAIGIIKPVFPTGRVLQ